VQQGAHVLVINYMLCPKATIGEIVKQVRRGYRWIVDHSATLGLDSTRLILVGHSAGAHLAASIITDPQLPAPYAILGLSGIYDLQPLVQTSMNQELKLDEPTARALSPLLSDRPEKKCRLHLYDGGLESSGFHYQTNALAQAWGAEAHGQLPGLHHFSILDPLKDEKSMLFQCCKRLIESAA
jgi:arylformamidase